VHGIGGPWKEAAGEFVLALGAGLKSLESLLDAVLQGTVIAHLEV
jgi:hypothetical protein